MFNQEAKEKLLFACREVMLCLVPLLEVSDRYDCEKIIKQGFEIHTFKYKLDFFFY